MIKKPAIVILVFTVVAALLAWQYRQMISYLAVQGTGQLQLLLSARDIAVYLDDAAFPEEKKEKIRLIGRLKEFARENLGLVDNGSYEKLYDQKGKPILWMVKAAPPYSLEPHTWSFPIAGRFSYISYFNVDDAQKAARRLHDEGYDVWISEVSAWSTLGYFKDPILSSMLERSEGLLARLIFHEMTHGTVFVKGDMKFNENLATFIGDTAAAYYLETAYGPTSPEVTKYRENLEDSRLLNRHLVRGAERLRILYASFDDDPSLTPEKKKEQKRALIRSIMDEAASLPYHTPERFARFREFSPNNAWFTGFLTYNEDVSALQEEFVSTFGSDYRKMIAHYRKMHMK